MSPIARLRRICLALPEAVEQETWEIPTFRVGRRIFALASAHHDREAVWCKAPPGAAAMLIEAAPARFFRPPYLGHKGWVGLYLRPAPARDEVDWDEVAFIVRRSHALVAPRRVARPPLAHLPLAHHVDDTPRKRPAKNRAAKERAATPAHRPAPRPAPPPRKRAQSVAAAPRNPRNS